MTTQARYHAWRDFHRDNPHVFALFVRFALEARKYRDRFSAHAIGERIRWHSMVETSGEPYKINDHAWPYYARLAMLTYPDLDGFFVRKDARFDATDEEILQAHMEAITA